MRSRSSRFITVVAAVATVFLALLAPPLSGPSLADHAYTQREVEEALTCQCGCGLTVATCNHLECGFAVPVRKEIAESLARGETGPEILERYKKEYGEKVLSSPVPEGFNLLAWIGPYLAIVVSGLVMFTFFRRRAAQAPAPQPDSATATATEPEPAPDDDRLARLRREVEDLER